MSVAPADAGWNALGEGDWDRARDLFEGALAEEETPKVFEGLGWSGYFLDDGDLTIGSRERAYRAYRAQGDDSAAGRVASWLAADAIEFRGQEAVGNGWLQRAHSLLDPLPPGPDHGWLAINEGALVMEEDPALARDLGRLAVELGGRFGVAELEALGLAIEGQALVRVGKLDEGMRCLDEATTIALAGEAESLVCVAAAGCSLIAACEEVRDYERASEWSLRIRDFCERRRIGVLLGVCQAKYASMLAWKGQWDEAEQELALAIERVSASRPGLVGEALVHLAEFRLWQGQIDEATALLDRCDGIPRALLVRARVALDSHQHEEAQDLADRYLRRFEPGRIERAIGLEIAVDACVRMADHNGALRALDELRDLVDRVGTGPLQASVLTLEGIASAATGDYERAQHSFEDSLDILTAAGGVYESARIRIELADTLNALDRRDSALRELDRAAQALRELGATGDLSRAELVIAKIERADRPAGTGPLDILSNREQEVLALVADGLTNGQIAERLFISEHTVHRHVANILRKLAVPSRTAAASLAGRHGLA